MIKKKKIFVAVTNDVSTDQRMHKVCDHLISKNFDVLVYGRVLPNTFDVKRAYQIKRKKHWFNNNFLFYAEYNIRLFVTLLFYKCDYILANDLDTLTACFFANKLKNSELVYDSHELFSEGAELQGRSFVQNFWRTLENWFLPRIEKSYTVSQSIANFYNNKYNTKMGVIRNVPILNKEITTLNAKFPTKNKTVLYQGVLNPGRGIKPMIKALHLLEDVDLVIIGYGKVKEELINYVKTEKLEKRVHFLGRIAHEDLPNYTMLANVGMVLEEPLGLSFQFSLPNKLFDYIHAELPIICGALPEIKIIVEKYNAGVIVNDYSPETISKALKKLLDETELYNKIKLSQSKAKKELCWEEEKQLLNNYFN